MMRPRISERKWIRRVLCAGAVLCVLPLAGCYERVVGARGFGADSVKIYQPSVGGGSRSGEVTVQRMKVTPMSKGKSKKPW